MWRINEGINIPCFCSYTLFCAEQSTAPGSIVEVYWTVIKEHTYAPKKHIKQTCAPLYFHWNSVPNSTKESTLYAYKRAKLNSLHSSSMSNGSTLWLESICVTSKNVRYPNSIDMAVFDTSRPNGPATAPHRNISSLSSPHAHFSHLLSHLK